MRLFRWSRAHRATTLLLVPLLAACNGPAEPVCDDGHDPSRLIVVRGRLTTEDGAPIYARSSIAFGTTAADCTGDIYTGGRAYPDAQGFYQGEALSPKLLPPQRCVWVIADTDLTSDTAGSIPATLRFRCGGEPLDTLEINVVLKRRTE